MNLLKILAGVIVILILLGQIRLGGGIKYSADGLFVRLRFGLFQFSIFPLKKAPKEKPAKQEKEKQERAEKERGGPLELLRRSLPLACEAAGEMKRKIQIDRLDLSFIAASEDAASTAMAFGYANMILGMIWPLFEQNFSVKEHNIQTSVDFDSTVPTVYINAAVSLKLGQLIGFGLRYGGKLVRIYMSTSRARTKRMKNQKEAINDERTSTE